MVSYQICVGEEDENYQGCDCSEVQDVRERRCDSPWGGSTGRLHHPGAAQGKAAASDKPG